MKKTMKIIFLMAFMWVVLTAFSKVSAATATIAPAKKSATVGDTVKVTVSINAASWNLKVSGEANDSIVGYNSEGENQKTTKVYNIKPSKAGTYTVSLSGDVTDGTTDKNSSINTSTSIIFKEKTTTTNPGNNNNNNSTTTTKKSNNANLKTLGVTPKEYDFSGFSKSKTSYSVTIPNNVDSLKVAYKTEDSKASVKVSGNSGFEVGSNNQIKVVVTAEDGTTQTYTIKVTKLAEDEEKPGNIIDDDKNDGLYLTSLNIKGIELSPKFAKDTFSYTATLSDSSVNELEVEAKANNEKANIAISGNTNLEDGENTINIILTLDDSSEQTIYQIVVNKETTTLPTTTSSETTPTSNNDFMGSIKTYIGIVIAVILLVIIAIIVLIVLLRKENKKLRDEGIYDEEYDEELSKEDKETLEEINKQTNEIFKDKVQGQSVEYGEEDLEERKNRRDKGRHF